MINYYLITKPGIIMGNIITVAAGFALASQGSLDYGLCFATLLGLTLVMASACVFNNYIDRSVDQKMERTKKRALVTGVISVRNAIIFASFLGLSGVAVLALATNLLTLSIASAGFFIYVLLYSLWKCRTVYGTAIGSLAGAVPPLVGYCALSNRLDLGAVIFFAIMVLWQMPHFFAIAIYRLEDYAAASIPVLPLAKGVHSTKIRMLFYIAAFILSSLLLPLFGYTGYLYLIVTALLGITWFWLGVKGFKCANDAVWARGMFRFSLVAITGLCIMILLKT